MRMATVSTQVRRWLHPTLVTWIDGEASHSFLCVFFVLKRPPTAGTENKPLGLEALDPADCWKGSLSGF